MQDLIGLLIVGVEGGVVALLIGTVIARRAFLNGNQRDFDEGERALTAAGFHVERVMESTASASVMEAPSATQTQPATVELTRALSASINGARVRIERTRKGAHCTLHAGPVRAVSRATFSIKRQRFFAGDIAIGDRRFDAAFHIDGWPKNRVAAMLAQPAVRAAIERLFARASVESVALVAHGEAGAVRVKSSLPWPELGTLRDVVDDARTLAEAVDQAMWVDAELAELERSRVDPAALEAATSSTSGAPFAVPVKR